MRIASLDGLRAISICLVLLAHLDGTIGFQFSGCFWHLGYLGVRVFFVISGFLITGLLLADMNKAGTINLPKFYFRRSMRLFPAAFFLIACMAAAKYAGLVSLTRRDLFHASTYTMNFYTSQSWSLGHLWSLAVEEQFYLLWPAALLVLGIARAKRAALLCIVASPLLRVALIYFFPTLERFSEQFLLTCADALAIGCLLAMYRDELWNLRPYRSVLQSRLFVLVPCMGLFLANIEGHTLFNALIGITLINAACMMSIDWSMRNAASTMGRFLNWKPVGFVGVLSYSLYLWQQPFIYRKGSIPFPLNLGLAISAALFSYYFIERPGLRLRERMESTNVIIRRFHFVYPYVVRSAAAAVVIAEGNSDSE